MATDSVVEISKGHGPNGFLEFNQNYYAVTDGKIAGLDGTTIGVLYEDGVIEGKLAPFDGWANPKSIEELPGCIFRGIDSQGISMEIPSAKDGPTGLLTYNLQPLTVIHGRISTKAHKILGEMDDEGTLTFRDHKNPSQMHVMDETCQLHTSFRGIKSTGQPFPYEFERPLHKRKDLPYSDNEILTYFDLDWHKLNDVEKDYILKSLKLWSCTGLLQVVRKETKAGRAMFGNVRHGASGVTGVLTAYVTIDRDEFETEIKFYRNYGVLSIHTRQQGAMGSEVRVNLVVSHEYGHQLEMALSKAAQDRITELYEAKLAHCKINHPLAAEYEGGSELIPMEQIDHRCFISGYSRTSMHEYWAEALAAFSVTESPCGDLNPREALRKLDPGIHQFLCELVLAPETLLNHNQRELAAKLQTSLRVGGELSDDLLNP
jgi:hypothetical protein